METGRRKVEVLELKKLAASTSVRSATSPARRGKNRSVPTSSTWPARCRNSSADDRRSWVGSRDFLRCQEKMKEG